VSVAVTITVTDITVTIAPAFVTPAVF